MSQNNFNSRLFEGLAKSEVASILAASSERRYLANSVVTHQGGPAEYMFLLKEGSARHFVVTMEGKQIPLFWLRPGDLFGGVTLLKQAKPYLTNTEMMKESRAFVWHRTLIRDLAVRYPRLADNMLLIAYDYFTWYIATHMALVSQTAGQRLAYVTVTLAQGIGRKVSGGIELDLTNEELANAANITPFTASRLLSGWQRTGAIKKSRGKILLRSSEQLLGKSDLEVST